MATKDYIQGRSKYSAGRPQAMLFSDNPGTLQDGFYVPDGAEFENFIVLSDHNRGPISFNQERIENRVRTINGRMRSYHIADKIKISTDWKNLPSRSASSRLQIDEESGETFIGANDLSYVVDNGAGAVDLLNWYENNNGSFWVFIAYDKFTNFELDYDKLGQYNQIVEVFFEDFSYNVSSRGQKTHDFWDVSLSLEEV